MPALSGSSRRAALGHGLMLSTLIFCLGTSIQPPLAVARLAGASSLVIDPQDMFFVTDDDATGYQSGCDAIAVNDSETGELIASGETIPSPGRLAASAEGDLVVAQSNNNGLFLYVLARMRADPSRWQAWKLDNRSLVEGGPIAITPDNRFLLVSVTGAAVEVHQLSLLMSTAPLGRQPSLSNPFAVLRGRGAVAAIVVSPDSQVAYLICADGMIYPWSLDTFVSAGAPFTYAPIGGGLDRRVRNTNAAVSPDGRWLAINGAAGKVNIVDTMNGRSSLVKAPGLNETWGLAFNHASPNQALLAVHGMSAVAIYMLEAGPMLRLLTLTTVPAQVPEYPPVIAEWARLAALAWTGRGDGLIAAMGLDREFRVLDFHDGANPSLKKRFDVDGCVHNPSYHMPLDVLSLNDRLHIPSPTPTTTPSETKAPTDVPPHATPTATASMPSTPTPTSTASPVPTVVPSSTPAPTGVPVPLYLPVILRERCDPGVQRVDIALVIDTSSSMTELTPAGRTKLAVALDAARVFLDQLRMADGDQAAVVTFNHEATLRSLLSSDRTVLDAALAAATTAQYTRIDLGIAAARTELASSRHRPSNTPVMIVLTDGRANPVPVSVAEGQARQAKDAGVVIFTIGLGSDLDTDALRAIASRPEWYYSAPSADELAGIYRGIAVAIPCPASAYWGQR